MPIFLAANHSLQLYWLRIEFRIRPCSNVNRILCL